MKNANNCQGADFVKLLCLDLELYAFIFPEIFLFHILDKTSKYSCIFENIPVFRVVFCN